MSEYVGLVKGKVHDKREMSEYYCCGCGYPVTDHDSYCRECGGELHEGMGKSRWAQLFGTPERAARTLFESTSECRCCVIRDECGYDLDKCVMYDRDALLEWLKGASDGE